MTRSLAVATTRYVALMVTRRCNMTCTHCSVASGPTVQGDPTLEDLLDRVRGIAAAGTRSIRLTGGEPMLREAVVLRLLEECRRVGLVSAITTNGFWGRSPRAARRVLKELASAGLNALTVSVDSFHAPFQGTAPAVHIAQAARACGLPVTINVVRDARDTDLEAITAPFDATPDARLRFYDLQPVGRARSLPDAAFGRTSVEGFCSACAAPALTEDGRLMACNGPAYFAPPDSPLIVGSLADASLPELLARHASDPILDTIRTGGPARLREELRRLPGFQTAGDGPATGICDLCHRITSNASAVAALRVALSTPRQAAERRALQRVIAGARDGGILSLRYVNGEGFCRAMVQVALAPDHQPTAESARLLQRADIDWRRRAQYVSGAGLARVVLDAVDASAVKDWVPPIFTDLLSDAAGREDARARTRLEIRHLVDAATAESAAWVVDLDAGGSGGGGGTSHRVEPRVPGHSSFYVHPQAAAPLRRALRVRGFLDGGAGRDDAVLMTFGGTSVTFCTRLAPRVFGWPERALLACTRPARPDTTLRVLEPDAAVFYASAEPGPQFFSGGLGAGWDLLTAVDRHPNVDWTRFATWVSATRLPRSVWVSLRAFSRTFPLAIPAEVLGLGPSDERARVLGLLAESRLFLAAGERTRLPPFVRHGVLWLLHDSWPERVRYLATGLGTLREDASMPGASVAEGHFWRQAADDARATWRYWTHYRRQRLRLLTRPAMSTPPEA